MHSAEEATAWPALPARWWHALHGVHLPVVVDNASLATFCTNVMLRQKQMAKEKHAQAQEEARAAAQKENKNTTPAQLEDPLPIAVGTWA